MSKVSKVKSFTVGLGGGVGGAMTFLDKKVQELEDKWGDIDICSVTDTVYPAELNKHAQPDPLLVRVVVYSVTQKE